MSVMMVRAKVKAESRDEVEASARKMFSAIEQAQPQGVRYASCTLPDGATFVALLELENGGANPLPALSEFRAFQESLRGWVSEPPTTEPLTVVGSYRLF
jgi:hypothetical protein